jgi:hypothetical protein
MRTLLRYAGTLAIVICVGAAPTTTTTTPSATTATGPTKPLTDPAFWLERAQAEWDRIEAGGRKPWAEFAAAQLAVRDRTGLARTLEGVKALEPPQTKGYPYSNDPTVYLYSELVPTFAQAGDEEGMRRAIAIATDPSREAGPAADSTPLDAKRAWIATRLAKIGRDADALKVARTVRDPWDRTQALTDIAVIAAQAGRAADSSRAFAAATQAAALAEKKQKELGLRPLAHGYLKAGNIVKALEVGESLSDESRAALLAGVAVAHSKAGRSREAAEHARQATDMVVKKRLHNAGSEVARCVAEIGHEPSIARLIERANVAQAERPPQLPSARPPAPAPGGRREMHLGEGFADGCFVGLADGSARRGDVQAAKQYLERSASLQRSVNGNTVPLRWYEYALLQVAVGLMDAGKFDDAVSLVDSIPLTISPVEAANNSSATFTLSALKNNIIQVYENGGKLDRAGQLWQEAHGSRMPMVYGRVRFGQLEPLLAEIEAVASPSARCLLFAHTARELSERRARTAATSRPVRP